MRLVGITAGTYIVGFLFSPKLVTFHVSVSTLWSMALAGVDFVLAGIFRGFCSTNTHSSLPGSLFGLLFLNLSVRKLRAIQSSQENFNHDSHMNKAGYNINVAWLPMTLARSSFVIENGILSFFLGGFVPFSCKYAIGKKVRLISGSSQGSVMVYNKGHYYKCNYYKS